jgi:hypothetical protein
MTTLNISETNLQEKVAKKQFGATPFKLKGKKLWERGRFSQFLLDKSNERHYIFTLIKKII